MVTGIQSETIGCPGRDKRKIWKCQNDDYGKWDRSCERLEVGINCTLRINEKCATDATFAKGWLLRGPLPLYTEPCFDQRFDQFFNQDGMCSFQNIKE